MQTIVMELPSTMISVTSEDEMPCCWRKEKIASSTSVCDAVMVTEQMNFTVTTCDSDTGPPPHARTYGLVIALTKARMPTSRL